MKRKFTKLKIELTFAVSVFLAANGFAQFNPQTNAPYDLSSGRTQFTVAGDTVLNSVPCTPDDFYSTDVQGDIRHYQLSGSAVTSAGVIIQKPGCYCIAVNDNLDGGNPNPTFYGDSFSHLAPVYYDINGWMHQSPAPPASWELANCGGAGPYSYYIRLQNNQNHAIVRYDGTAWTTLFTSSAGRRLMVADLAVDAMGNVYFFGGPIMPNSFWCDSMYIMSPSGQITTQLPFAMNLNHAYGSMFIHGVFHVGLGVGNQNLPDVLLPVEVINNTVVLGTPVSFQCTGCYDLASCDPGGLKSAIAENNSPYGELLVSPNPAASVISFTGTGRSTWEIYSAEGRRVMQGSAYGSGEVEVTSLSAGMYFLRSIDEQGEVRTARFIIER